MAKQTKMTVKDMLKYCKLEDTDEDGSKLYYVKPDYKIVLDDAEINLGSIWMWLGESPSADEATITDEYDNGDDNIMVDQTEKLRVSVYKKIL